MKVSNTHFKDNPIYTVGLHKEQEHRVMRQDNEHMKTEYKKSPVDEGDSWQMRMMADAGQVRESREL